MPNINDQINEIAQYHVFSTIDLQSAYHQVPLRAEDRPYTAFEANNNLLQFTRLPFGVTNGVACFQREMMNFVRNENLKAVFPYLDNITICGKNQEEHDANLEAFLDAAKRKNITYNESKSVFSTKRLPILGYVIENGEIRPDPDRLKPLREMPIPHDSRSLKRCLGMFSYYSKWIPCYSDKLKVLLNSKSFPLSQDAVDAFHGMKKMLEAAVVRAIDDKIPFVVETDASDYALAATLSQDGRPVAFFSRCLQGPELRYPSIEKEAQAIIEAIRRWRHLLTNKHFLLKTDQKSVAFMFDRRHKGKIKNDKILRWRMELSCYSFDIIHQPGRENIAADTLSRSACALSAATNSLYKLHESLCHPGVTRLCHFVRSRNLPYSIEEVKRVTSECRICCECKPRFFRPDKCLLIKATKPFERLSLDFKGPLPSVDKNVYFLNVIDEYSRFPFVFPCADVSAQTVIKCLTTLFSICGMPAFVHSDRGAAFMSRDLRDFLLSKGVCASRTTSFNPAGNGQVERYNGTIWKAITMALRSRGLPPRRWQDVLPDALHSVRSLLCTATNETPHERFFAFQRKSSVGGSVPSWLMEPGRVLVKRHVRAKTDPLVDEVELLEATPNYAYVRYPDGRETTVSTKHLAPTGGSGEMNRDWPQETPESDLITEDADNHLTNDSVPESPNPQEVSSDSEQCAQPRRSERARRPVVRFGYNSLGNGE